MHLNSELTYPASVPEVGAMLATEAFVRWRAQRIIPAGENAQLEVSVTGTADGPFTVVVLGELPSDRLPSQARSFVGSTVRIRQVESWEAEQNGRRDGTIAVDVVGTPVRLRGTVTLAPSPEGTVQAYTGELKAGIPLLGGKIEKAAAGPIRSVLAAQESAGREWLTAP